MFEKVSRRAAKVRIALTGVSGAGKTLSALYLAYGITGDWGKVALIDTEHERARLYANREDLPHPVGEFLYCALDAPFSPEKYKRLVSEGAQAVGPDGCVIVDSLSHAWNAEGGVLELKEQIASQAGKNSYTAWMEAGQEQTRLINSILSVDCHTIVTMRSKMAYALETNERGKQQPVKVGLAPVQRDDTEYEFDIVLNIERSHIATASKDVTFLDRFGEIITPALGTQLRDWMANGTPAPKRPVCELCGEVIHGTAKSSGEEFAAKTRAIADMAMCESCMKKFAKDRQRILTDSVKDRGLSNGDISGMIKGWVDDGELQHARIAEMTVEEFARCIDLFTGNR